MSNELPAAAGDHPVGVDRRKLRKVAPHHLAWAEVVHEATMQLDRKAPQVAASWDRLVRQVCLRKTGELGTDVVPLGRPGAHGQPVGPRRCPGQGHGRAGLLDAGLRIPGAVGPMLLKAQLRTGLVEIAVDVAAPDEGRPLTRVNGLLRQLPQAPDALRVDAVGTRPADGRSELLRAARTDPKLLLPHDAAPKTFRLTLALPLGRKRGIGRGGFITSVHEAVDTFYRDVMQDLVPWPPASPKLPAHDAAATEDQPEASDDARAAS